MIANGLASSLSAMVWGRMADVSSKRVMLRAAALAALLGFAVVLVDVISAGTDAVRPWIYAAFFLVLGIAHSGVRIGRALIAGEVGDGHPEDAACSAMAGAVLSVLLGADDQVVVQGPDALRAGAAGVTALDAGLLEPGRLVQEHDFKPAGEAIRMPAGPASDAEPDLEWAQRIRRFHISGHGAVGAAGQAPGVPVQPAALTQIADEARAAADRLIGGRA